MKADLKMIYYIADTHFGYKPILWSAARPFATTDEMDAVIIKNWNDTVNDDDVVYIVGDFAYDKGEIPAFYFEQLRGRKHLIRGNHDVGLDDQERLFDYCESVTDFLEIDDSGYHIQLCHYPFVHHKRALMIHGHIHNRRGPAYQMLKSMPNVLNAGVDINFFKPVTIEQLIKNNEMYYSEKYPELFINPELPQYQHSDEEWDEMHRWTSEHFRTPGNKKPDFRPLPVRNI